MNQLFKSQLKRESKKLTHDQFKIPKSSTSVYTNKNSYLGALLRSANLALLFFFVYICFLSFGYELKPIPSLQLETIWSEGQAKGAKFKAIGFSACTGEGDEKRKRKKRTR